MLFRSTFARFLLLVNLFAAFAGAAQVYKYVDKDGGVHYTDRPPADVQKTEIRIQQPEAPIKKRDAWREEELDLKVRLADARHKQQGCDMAKEHHRQMKAALDRDRRTLIYIDGQRVTQQRLESMQQYLREYSTAEAMSSPSP